MNFWGSDVWGTLNLVAVLLLSMMAATVMKNVIKPLRVSLIPTSVLGGLILLVLSSVYEIITKEGFFDANFFNNRGFATLETVTYHALALGFIASALKTGKEKMSKKRTIEIFDSGVTTVATYLLQGILGMAITMAAALVLSGFFSAAGILLPFGYGQGTGQAMNYGNIYEMDYGFDGGKGFGLTIAALGFLSASIGGVVHLNYLRRKGKILSDAEKAEKLDAEQIQSENEIPMQGSMDKITVQMALILGSYFVAHLLMTGLGMLLPGMKSTIYGFNFLLGVIAATLVKVVMGFLYKHKAIKREYANNFLLTRCSNFFFDVMVVAGIAAIRLSVLEQYWGIMLILGLVGAVSTYIYLRIVAVKLFPKYKEEQFLATYGMLTGTASTGIILLREIDEDFKTPAADNMVYQTLPAIVFGFPIMLLATLAPVKPVLTWVILILFFIVMNVILFRSLIFKKKKK